MPPSPTNVNASTCVFSVMLLCVCMTITWLHFFSLNFGSPTDAQSSTFKAADGLSSIFKRKIQDHVKSLNVTSGALMATRKELSIFQGMMW